MTRILRPLDDSNGMALIICLLVMAVLTTIGTTAILVTSTNQKIAGNFKRQAQAFCIAEAGLQISVAKIKANPMWRGEEVSSPHTITGTLDINGINGLYTATLFDSTDDNIGIYDAHMPGGHVKVESVGVFGNSTQAVQCLVELTPDDSSDADSPYSAVVTSGGNSGSGAHAVNGYNSSGVLDPSMVQTNVTLPTVNQEALKAFADFTFNTLTNTEISTYLSGINDFWKDPPVNTRPYIIHVTGDMDIQGDVTVYGIIFVEGSTVDIRGAARVHGVVYAPNATVVTQIHGGGTPGDQPVMGQVISGTGGVYGAGNHADVQLVDDYVDAFNNFGGDHVIVTPVDGTWKQS